MSNTMKRCFAFSVELAAGSWNDKSMLDGGWWMQDARDAGFRSPDPASGDGRLTG